MRTDQEIVDQTEELANWLLCWKWGQANLSSKHLMRNSPATRAQYCWRAACAIQEMLTQTDVENALAGIEGLEDEYAPKKKWRNFMSYDIYLKHPITEEAITLDHPHQMYGGTYQVGGSKKASLNITYNYSFHYYRLFGEHGIRLIYGMSGAESIAHLEKAIAELGDDVTDDYWEPTEGNAKAALLQLMALAQMRPDAVWDGD